MTTHYQITLPKNKWFGITKIQEQIPNTYTVALDGYCREYDLGGLPLIKICSTIDEVVNTIKETHTESLKYDMVYNEECSCELYKDYKQYDNIIAQYTGFRDTSTIIYVFNLNEEEFDKVTQEYNILRGVEKK